MKTSGIMLWLARILALLLVAGLAALAFYLPLATAVVFVVLVTAVAIVRGRTEGFGSGVRWFLKEILFGW